MTRFIQCILVAVLLTLPQLSDATELTLDEKACGTSLRVTVGDALIICLQGNSTTGYTWGARDVPTQVQQLGDPVYRSDSKLVGAGGITSFRFSVVSVGDGVLNLVYRRLWEKEMPPARSCRIQLNNVTTKNLNP